MASLGIDGLISGLKTTDLINSMIQVEAAPQILLNNKVTKLDSVISSLGTLNGLVQSLQTKAADAAKSTSLSLYSAKSSASSVTATVDTTAGAGEVSFKVASVAKAQTTITSPMTEWSIPASLTITGADGTAHVINAASSSLSDIVSAVNSADLGVRAVRVSAGTTVGGQQQYRIQFMSTSTGVENAFSVQAAAAENGTASSITTVNTATAADAEIVLFAGVNGAETKITSSKNTFDDLMPGLDVTVSAVTDSDVTVSVAADTAKQASVASGLVTAMQSVFSYIASNTRVTSSTDDSGNATTSAGVLTGDAGVRQARGALANAITYPIDGRSPSSIGITVAKDGTVSFDEATFTAAMAADPTGTSAMLQGIAGRIDTAASAASDQYDGYITSKIEGQNDLRDNFNKQIDSWDDRLAARRATLERTYANLETTLSQLQSQGDWLTSQLEALKANN